MIYDVNGNILEAGGGQNFDLYWRRGIFNTSTGSLASLSPDALTILSSAFVFVRAGAVISAANGFTMKLAYYEDFSLSGFAGVDASWDNSKTISADSYVIIAIKKNDGSFITFDDVQDAVGISGVYYVASFRDKPPTLGASYRQQQLLDKTDHVLDILAGYPMLRETISTDQKCYGIPYSAKNDTEGYVGVDVSMYTYLSTVRTNKSVIYNDSSGGPNWRDAYYGIDCSGLVSGSLGFKDTLPTNLIATMDIFSAVSDPMTIQIGDILLKTGHAKSITNIERDQYGRIILVGANDASIPRPGHQAFFWSEFQTELLEYTIKRYEGYDRELFSSPLSYVFPSDIQAQYTYPDIMPYLGDKKTILSGSNVSIIVVNASGYSTIEVYKNGTKIDTKSSIEDFTISSPAVGAYEVRMIGTEKQSSCYFNVVSLSATLSSTTLSFSTSGCTPYSISAYKAEGTSSGEAINLDKQMIHFITAAEISAGSADVSDLVAYASANGGYLKIKAYDNYGTVYKKITL